MTVKKVTSASTTWNYELIKGLSCDHLVGEGFFFSPPRKTESEALCFVIPFFMQKRLVIQIGWG